ncbi:hypothetical protein LBMAG42_34670 [Deltaproteobacteria bacterium]|nr:hypothetical protein LBMAG42_34670 [Deltaproteobacteria bacterium]
MNAAIAASFALAGVRTALHGAAAAWVLGAFQLAVALAFLARDPERRRATWPTIAGALPSLAASGFVIAAGGSAPWSAAATLLVAAGTGVATMGLLSLGRSFAVLPGVRTLRTTGLYRWVRHPIYLGETLILAGAATRLGVWGAAGVLAVLPLVAWRILLEERLLSAEADWAEWSARVRWRLLPGVW